MHNASDIPVIANDCAAEGGAAPTIDWFFQQPSEGGLRSRTRTAGIAG